MIYEVLWVRLFVLVMGGTVYSFTTVLVAFMAGLALGGWLGGKYADRMKRSPLLVYAALEGVIGLYCLMIPFLISGLDPVFTLLHPFVSAHNLAGLLLRFFFSGLVLLLPCTLMGATLPILVRYSFQGPGQLGKTTASLYAVNTFGAVAGSLASGMILLPKIGQSATLYFAAGINFFIFFSILFLVRLRRPESGPVQEQVPGVVRSPGAGSGSALLLLLYGLSGAAAMVYQVAWTRALILSLGTTLYVLSMILTAFIAGLGLGALAVRPMVDRISRLWLWTGVLELLVGFSAWLVVPLFARLPLWMAAAHRPDCYFVWLSEEFFAGFALIFIPTFAMGALLPLVVRLYQSLRGGAGSAVGAVYAWNTIGAIFGAFLCGFFLISRIGLRNSLILASVANVGVGLAFILNEKKMLAAKLAAFAAAIASISALFFLVPGWDPQIINSGPYLNFNNYGGLSAADIEQSLKSDSRNLFYKEGAEATVSVSESITDGALSLRINGKADASTGDDMITQVFLGHFPFLFNPGAEKVMVLGLASAVTLNSVLTHPVKQAVCLEISPEVVEASKYFGAVNHHPLKDARTVLIVSDARDHLAHSADKYDAIISEPSNPWIGGEGLLFTDEFFKQARARLNPGGVMVLWIGIYDLDVEALRMLARTFINEFPQATLWESVVGSDYLFVGAPAAAVVDYSAFKVWFNTPRVKYDFERVGIDWPEQVIARFLMGPRELAAFAGVGPLHTDDKRQLEMRVPEVNYLRSFGQNTVPSVKAIREHRGLPGQYLKFDIPEDEKDLLAIDDFRRDRLQMTDKFILMIK